MACIDAATGNLSRRQATGRVRFDENDRQARTWPKCVEGGGLANASALTTFLHSFDGRFAGTGRLERADGSGHALTCKFKGISEARHVVVDGLCSPAVIFATSMRIDIRYDTGTGRYSGSFRESMGTIADLVVSRQGASLSLAFAETPESIRPNPPARLKITRRDDDVVLTLRGTKPGRGQSLDLVLRQS